MPLLNSRLIHYPTQTQIPLQSRHLLPFRLRWQIPLHLRHRMHHLPTPLQLRPGRPLL